MGIAEELKSLEELHAKGKLRDAEYSAAKASTLRDERRETIAARIGDLLVRMR